MQKFYFNIVMVQSLRDICLMCIARNLHLIHNIRRNLPTVYKENVIHWLVSHDMLTISYLPYITYNLFTSALRHISLYHCNQVNDQTLKLLAESECQLESLVINGCNNVTDLGVQYISNKQKKLLSLKLKRLNISDKGLMNIKSPCLTKLDLHSCVNITTEGVYSVVKNNPSIKVLHLSGVTKAKSRIFFLIAETLLTNLEELDCGLHVICDNGLMSVAELCPNLSKLTINGCMEITGKAIIKLSQCCTKLKKLDLSYCNGLQKRPNSEALWTLPTTLQEFSLCGVLLQDEQIFVECLQRLKSLKSVRLCGVAALNDRTFMQIMQHIGSNLVSIDVSSGILTNLTDKGLAAITKYCCRLEVLALSLLPEVKGFTLASYFKDMSHGRLIKELYMSCRKMSLEVLLDVFSFCPNLEKIDMAGLASVDDHLIQFLAEQCPKLIHVGIKGCRQVTDIGICDLAVRCPLQKLVLSGNHKITDKSIFALANHCHYLEEMYLNGCGLISATALQYLMDCCIPRVYIQHTVPNANPDHVIAKNLDTGEFCMMDGV